MFIFILARPQISSALFHTKLPILGSPFFLGELGEWRAKRGNGTTIKYHTQKWSEWKTRSNNMQARKNVVKLMKILTNSRRTIDSNIWMRCVCSVLLLNFPAFIFSQRKKHFHEKFTKTTWTSSSAPLFHLHSFYAKTCSASFAIFFPYSDFVQCQHFLAKDSEIKFCQTKKTKKVILLYFRLSVCEMSEKWNDKNSNCLFQLSKTLSNVDSSSSSLVENPQSTWKRLYTLSILFPPANRAQTEWLNQDEEKLTCFPWQTYASKLIKWKFQISLICQEAAELYLRRISSDLENVNLQTCNDNFVILRNSVEPRRGNWILLRWKKCNFPSIIWEYQFCEHFVVQRNFDSISSRDMAELDFLEHVRIFCIKFHEFFNCYFFPYQLRRPRPKLDFFSFLFNSEETIKDFLWKKFLGR